MAKQEISQRLAGALATLNTIRNSATVAEVQKFNKDGSKAGDPSLALVSGGQVLAILVTKPMHEGSTKVEERYDSWSGRYVSRTVQTPAKPRYSIINPA